VRREIEAILARLRREDPEFEAEATLMTYRAAYCLDMAHPLVRVATGALAAAGRSVAPAGMSFWTDAAILAGAGIPAVLFGPGGAGLHSIEEYVTIADVYACRDILREMVTRIVMSPRDS
jgi:acetylornithine deacetylase